MGRNGPSPSGPSSKNSSNPGATNAIAAASMYSESGNLPASSVRCSYTEAVSSRRGKGLSVKKPAEVFTPRSADVNDAMYIHRPDLEKALRNALLGTMNIIIHGESGTGKSWLYKRVFTNQNVEVMTANLANASRLKSIAAELQSLVEKSNPVVKIGYDESKKADIGIPGLGAGVGHTGHYVIKSKEPFEACLELLRHRAGTRQACLVLDNLERVFENQEFMTELADLITLLDDARYAQYKVKMLVVGVPDDVKRYFSRIPNLTTVANRISEIPEVARLTNSQAQDFIVRGLFGELKYRTVGRREDVIKHISWVTDRIPQQLHEYCLELANIVEERERTICDDDLILADRQWLQTSLESSYVAVEAMMNSRETSVGRRNQTLYALGQFDGEDFTYSDIEGAVRQEFPMSTVDIELNIPQILDYLAKLPHPLIRRTPKQDAYRFINPKHRMGIRAMLRKTDQETVEKMDVRTLLWDKLASE